MALCKTFTENHQHDPFCCCTLDARWLEGAPAGNFLMRVPLPNIINVHQMQNQPCWGFQENQTFYQWLHQVSLSFSQFTEHHLLLFSSAQFIRTNFPWTFQWWGVKQKGCEAPWTALAPLWALFLRAHLWFITSTTTNFQLSRAISLSRAECPCLPRQHNFFFQWPRYWKLAEP